MNGGWVGLKARDRVLQNQRLIKALKVRGVSESELVRIVDEEQRDPTKHTIREVARKFNIPLRPLRVKTTSKTTPQQLAQTLPVVVVQNTLDQLHKVMVDKETQFVPKPKKQHRTIETQYEPPVTNLLAKSKPTGKKSGATRYNLVECSVCGDIMSSKYFKRHVIGDATHRAKHPGYHI